MCSMVSLAWYTAFEIDANNVYLALLEELRCVAGLLEHGTVRIETPLHLQIERIEFSIRLASLPMLRSLPVGFAQASSA